MLLPLVSIRVVAVFIQSVAVATTASSIIPRSVLLAAFFCSGRFEKRYVTYVTYRHVLWPCPSMRTCLLVRLSVCHLSGLRTDSLMDIFSYEVTYQRCLILTWRLSRGRIDSVNLREIARSPDFREAFYKISETERNSHKSFRINLYRAFHCFSLKTTGAGIEKSQKTPKRPPFKSN